MKQPVLDDVPGRAGTAAAVGMCLAGAVVLVLLVMGIQRDGDPLGSQDFVAYWSAFDVAVDGDNPYDLQALASAQAPLELSSIDEPQRFWNPPWTLLVLAPVLALPFRLAAATWLVLNLAAGVALAWTGWRLLGPRGVGLPPLALAGSLLFLPFLEALFLGQLSPLVAVVVFSAVLALRERRDIAAGVLVGLLATKPQTLLILLLVLGVHVLWSRRWVVVGAALATVAVFAGAAAVLLPSAFEGWDPVGGAPTYWQTASVAGWLRILLEDGRAAPEWPLAVVPLAALLLAIPWAWRQRRHPERQLLAVLAVSYLVAPYAWIFDATVLLPLHVVVFGRALLGGVRQRCLAWVLIGVQVLALVWRAQPWTYQHHMVWLPAALLAAELWRQHGEARPADTPAVTHSEGRAVQGSCG
jgi:hypothetical protein